MAIEAIQTQLPLSPVKSAVTPTVQGIETGEGPSFSSVIGDALQQVDLMQQQAGEVSAQVASGEAVDLHDALIRVEEAGLALQLAMQVRNKLVESYQEIMRMPV